MNFGIILRMSFSSGNDFHFKLTGNIPLSISNTQEPYCWFDVEIPNALTGYGFESSLMTIAEVFPHFLKTFMTS